MAEARAQEQRIAVKATGLTKVFKDFWGRPKARAVNGLDLTIRHGQVFGLLGPNGSGKSTTVKMLLGLLYPTRGQLEVLGQPATSVNAKRRIGYLPEESYLYRYLTATETLDFFGALFRIPAEERRRRCTQLLDMVGLGNAANRAVGEFSKGMARRIGLAQALINDPDLVILDEPTAGLDPIGCREVKDVIRLLASRGKTVILCSHLLADVEDVCDEVVVLYGGRPRARGGLRELLEVEDRTRITVPALEGAVLQKVLDLLRENLVTEGDIEVDRPSMNLEEFFLDVVRRAREESAETSGVEQGRIAAYLRGGDEDSTEAGRELLEALAAPDEEEEQVAEAGSEPKATVPAPDTSMLEQLSDRPVPEPEESAPQPREQAAAAAKKSEKQVHEASERLKGLLGKDDQ
jgi:ABC-2 type transport system ATP-binding protein